MTPDDTRDAAARLLKYAQVANQGKPWDTETAHKAVYKGTGFTRIEDEKAVCQAYLAEHPDDDTQPVSPEWVESLSIPDNGDGSYTLGRTGLVDVVWYRHGVAAEHSSQLCLYLHPSPGILTRTANPTRGQLRRLCAAIGVPLNEVKR